VLNLVITKENLVKLNVQNSLKQFALLLPVLFSQAVYATSTKPQDDTAAGLIVVAVIIVSVSALLGSLFAAIYSRPVFVIGYTGLGTIAGAVFFGIGVGVAFLLRSLGADNDTCGYVFLAVWIVGYIACMAALIAYMRSSN
jgi:hypothetical protein